jgi:hypothetical protein
MDLKNIKPVPLEPHSGANPNPARSIEPAVYISYPTASFISFYAPGMGYVMIARNPDYQDEVDLGTRHPKASYEYTIYQNDEIAGYLQKPAAERFIAAYYGPSQELEAELAEGRVSPQSAGKYREMVDSFSLLIAESGKEAKRKEGSQGGKTDTLRGPRTQQEKNEFVIWDDRAVITREGGAYWLEFFGPARDKCLVLDWEVGKIRSELQGHEYLCKSATHSLYTSIYSGTGIEKALVQYTAAQHKYFNFRMELHTREIPPQIGQPLMH